MAPGKLIALIAAGLLAGSGCSADTPEQTEVKRVVEMYEVDPIALCGEGLFAEEDSGYSCEYNFGGAEGLEDSAADAADTIEFVSEVEIDGSKASVDYIVKGGDSDGRSCTGLARLEHGKWKADGGLCE